MLISEVRKRNEEILNQAMRIQELINGCENLDDDIVNCGNAELYYTATASLSAQQKAPMGERFLCKQLGLTQVSSRLDRGDAHDENGLYYEFKNSFTNIGENLNIRQIRLWQDVDFYYCIYINEKDLNKSLFFVLTKEEMEKEVELCGGYTHGTVGANAVNQHSEYSITIPIYRDSNPKTKRWKENYLCEDLKNKVLGIKRTN